MKVSAAIGLIICLSVLGLPGNAQDTESPRRLSLDEALAIALKQNPDVAEGESRLAEAEARLRAARSHAWPSLKANGAFEHWTRDQRLYPATRNAEAGVFGSEVLRTDLMLSVPLYTGGRISGERDVAAWNREAATDRLTHVRESLVYQVTALFYGLLAQDAVVRSLETAVLAMDEQQRTIRELVEAEKAARVDLLRANVRRAELYEREIREKNNRAVQQRAWAALLGLDDAAAPEAKGTLILHDPPVCPDAAECMQKAHTQRADYRAVQAAISAADAALRAARSGYLPTLSAQASYGTRWMPDPSYRPDDADDLTHTGRLGVVVEMPLFDGRLTGARVAERRAMLQGAEARLRNLGFRIRYEVETALSAIATARERVATMEESIGQAEETYRIINEMYELGKGTMTDVLDAQTALVNAETQHARALADLAVADARLKLAMGVLWP